MNKERFAIAYIADTGFVMPTCVSITSLLDNQREEEYNIYVLVNDVTEEEKRNILSMERERAKINIVDITSENYAGLDENTCVGWNSHITRSALFKFGLAEYLHWEDKILYIDGDTLIVNNISKLCRMDMADNYVAAVDDMTPTAADFAEFINLNSKHYFNSGVMLLNLKKMREDNVYKKLIDYRANGKNRFVDQDTFNIVMRDRRIILPYKYNFLVKEAEEIDFNELCSKYTTRQYANLEMLLREQVILHYAGKYKPWKYYVTYSAELFLRYYAQSPYKEQKLNLKSLAKTIRIEGWERFKRTVSNSRKCWSIPYEKIEKGKKVIVYGAGDIGTDIMRQIDFTQYWEVVLWVDKNHSEMGSQVSNPEDIIKLNDIEYDYILIAILNERVANEVRHYLEDMGVSCLKIVNY